MSSSLLDQSSLYLRQHANQQVNWLTWSEESIKKAQKEDKPILLSIGYSSCHWCQEMSRNCFEDRYIASLMNRHFICILVDREENPELDHIYMEAIRMFDQSVGWPLHAFCLPDGRPFWGGTYFPKEDLGDGLAPWPQVLMRVAEHYRKAKNELVENAQNVIANILHSNNPDLSSGEKWNRGMLGIITEKLCDLHDDQYGGFTSAPKFPSPMKIDFFLSMQETDFLRSRKDKWDQVNLCIEKTLKFLTRGGIYDHLEGGFFRYCTDEKWTKPHYEKMLSDNALLLRTFARAFRNKPSENYLRIISGTISWLNKEMGNPEIGYCSSLSAEIKGKEGAFYEWTLDEMVSILGKIDAEKFFNLLPEISKNSHKKLPQLIVNEEISSEEQLNFISLLREHREKRPTPLRDEKRLLSHNSLLISAFIEVAIALRDLNLLEDAIRLQNWMSFQFLDKDNNLLSFAYPEKITTSRANLDDYCLWSLALLELHSVSSIIDNNKSIEYLEKAIFYAEKLLLIFQDTEASGFFFTEEDLNSPLPCRRKIWYDNSTPSGNSMTLRIFSTLYNLTGDQKWEKEFYKILNPFSSLAKKVPDGISYAMSSICDKELGFVSIDAPSVSPTANLDFVSKLPPRPARIRFSKSLQTQFQVFINRRKKLSSSDSQEVIKKLNS